VSERREAQNGAGAAAYDLPRAAGDERAVEPRRAELLRSREEVLPHAARRPSRRRELRALVRGAAGRPSAARRRGSREVLRAALRRASRLARRSPQRRRRLGGDRGNRRRRVLHRRSEERAAMRRLFLLVVSRIHVALYRLSGGRVGARIGRGLPVLLLTTT